MEDISQSEHVTTTPVFRTTSVTDDVYSHLRNLILAGLAPGHSWRLNDLANDLGVSTTPVRTALERLAADGFVILGARRTCRVAPLSVKDFKDIYEVRRCLEGAAARIGVSRLSDPELVRIQECARQIEDMVMDVKPDVDMYLQTEWEMHVTCYRAGDNPRMLKEIQSNRRQAERYLRLALSKNESIVDDLQGQREFFNACSTRDPVEAQRVAERLLDWTVLRVTPILEEIERESTS